MPCPICNRFIINHFKTEYTIKKLIPPRSDKSCNIVNPTYHSEIGGSMKITTPMSEFNEFEPRLKSAKNRLQLSAGLNLEPLNTFFSGTNHI